ncbi:MAG: type III polyketide synthase [Ardenticatenales bacterium]|jgi:predicted naringenin-chalcone synthase|nr:type III polyketide synthase [Ardenticatenales bacterium]
MGTGVTTRLYGLGTATPPHSAAQADVGTFMARVVAAAGPANGNRPVRSARLIRRLYAESGIARRHSVLADYACDDPAAFTFFPPNWALDPFPTTAERMVVYREASVELGARAAQQALADASMTARDVTHLVISTCTGFFAPGPDVLLLRRLGLAPNTARTVIGFMGCNAAFNGLRTADDIVRSNADAVVLQICVELCSLHFQRDDASETLIANCLFADGASAAVWAADGARPGGHAALLGTFSTVHDDSLDQMGWRIGDHGFVMTLTDAVPDTLARAIHPFVQSLLHRSRTDLDRVAGWAIHPGGRRIVEGIGRALELDEPDLASAYGVLRDHGNMSSATILFVLQRELDRLRSGSSDVGDGSPAERLGVVAPVRVGSDGRDIVGRDIVALGFGPGLSLEGAVLRATP